MTALEVGRWSTCCGSGHGWGYVSLAGCFTFRPSSQIRATWPCRIGRFLTTTGRADSLSLTRVFLFS